MVITALCRNCGAETARADLRNPPKKLWWTDGNGWDLRGYDFSLKACCGVGANPYIDIVIRPQSEEVVE